MAKLCGGVLGTASTRDPEGRAIPPHRLGDITDEKDMGGDSEIFRLTHQTFVAADRSSGLATPATSADPQQHPAIGWPAALSASLICP